MKSGIPFDVAFSLPHDERLAYVVVLGELDGAGTFDWSEMTFKPTK